MKKSDIQVLELSYVTLALYDHIVRAKGKNERKEKEN